MSRFINTHAWRVILLLLLSPLCIFASASAESESDWPSIHTGTGTCNNISSIGLCTNPSFPTAIHAIAGYVFTSCQSSSGYSIIALNRSNSEIVNLMLDGECHNPNSVRYVNSTQEVFGGCNQYIRSTTLTDNGGYNTPGPYCEAALQITVDETRGIGYAACGRSGASSSLISLPAAGGFRLLASEEDCGSPGGVAIDTVNNVLYAACYGNSSLPGSMGVISVDLDNNNQVKHLADEVTCPVPDTVAYDPISSTLYAICWGSVPNTPNSGVRAYDGTNWRTILNSSLCETFTALELDPKTGVLYVGCENLQAPSPSSMPSIYAYFQGIVSVVLTSDVCQTIDLSLDADGTLFAICLSQTETAISITGILCGAPVTSVVNGGVGSCGFPLSACNSCNITCNPGYSVVGASYYCSNGAVIGNQTCMADPCSGPPVVDTTLIDLTGGDHPCASINLPFTSFNSCSAVCKAHHPGSANEFQCVAAQWQGGPTCHEGTFCWCIGLALAMTIGAMCCVVVILFFVSSGFAVISTFSMMTSAADIVTDLLYISENDFYTKSVFILVLIVLICSTIMAIRASWRNHIAAAGSIGWPKPYGVAYLKSVELDQLYKLIGVVIGYLALVLLLPLFWMTWFMIAIIAASTKAMSMTAFRHIWLRVWTGESEEVFEQEDIDATDKDKQQEEVEPGAVGDKQDTTPAATTPADATDQIDANSPLHQRVDSTVYNTLLLYHLVFESLPMLVLQITNNTLLQSWTPLALASLILSSWCAASNLYVFAFHMLIKKRTIAQVPNDLKSGVLTKVARRLNTSPSNIASVAIDTQSDAASTQSLNQPLIQDSAQVYSSVSNEKA